ncbi:helix-turn-helix domain-containing protein [Winogradskyella sp.]
MKNILYYLSVITLCLFVSSCSEAYNQGEFTADVKVAMRSAGNQLLLSNNDSVSLVLPIKAISDSKFELGFEEQLFIVPTDLVDFLDTSFQKSDLPKKYRVEVIQCSDNEVAYSYEMSNEIEKTIIPCLDRNLPKGCYKIQVQFLGLLKSNTSNYGIIITIGSLILICLSFLMLRRKFNQAKSQKVIEQPFIRLGSYKFYAEQNKLIKEAVEISLSQKECELLEIFVANPNIVVKRDELTKRVWEDKGVIVGRSLDTYISKLRKKLKEDTSVKLVNVHGVGYKLEVSK